VSTCCVNGYEAARWCSLGFGSFPTVNTTSGFSMSPPTKWVLASRGRRRDMACERLHSTDDGHFQHPQEFQPSHKTLPRLEPAIRGINTGTTSKIHSCLSRSLKLRLLQRSQQPHHAQSCENSRHCFAPTMVTVSSAHYM
jgi:hypothetical protein